MNPLERSTKFIVMPRRNIRRATPAQLAYIERLERELGYKLRSHRNMPLYKAKEYIDTLQERLRKRTRQTALFDLGGF